jgi:hypothetical protein
MASGHRRLDRACVYRPCFRPVRSSSRRRFIAPGVAVAASSVTDVLPTLRVQRSSSTARTHGRPRRGGTHVRQAHSRPLRVAISCVSVTTSRLCLRLKLALAHLRAAPNAERYTLARSPRQPHPVSAFCACLFGLIRCTSHTRPARSSAEITMPEMSTSRRPMPWIAEVGNA